MRSLAVILTISGSLKAATVGFANIIATTTMPVSAFSAPTFTIDKIVDGISSDASPYNGFASDSIGIINLTFNETFTLTSFLLWNDVNVNAEGINGFNLRFFGLTDTLISVPFSASYIGPVGQLAAQEYVFSSAVPDVKRVEFEITSTQTVAFGGLPRTEIREVDFGVIPEPSSTLLVGLASLTLLRRNRKIKNTAGRSYQPPF